MARSFKFKLCIFAYYINSKLWFVMKRLLLAFIFCMPLVCVNAQHIEVDDNDYPKQKMRVIHSDFGTHDGWFDMKGVKSGRPSVRAYPYVSLHIDYLNAKSPKNIWYFDIRLMSESKLAFRKGARCLLKTQDGETITLFSETSEEDYLGDDWGGYTQYTVFAQFEIKQAMLNKLANKRIVKIRFELVSEILEFTETSKSGRTPLDVYVKNAKTAILERKNKKKDDLLDGF